MEFKNYREEIRNLFRVCGSSRAQTASELAIFGAILIFVIGVIVRSAMSSSQVMNQQLKAMRMAMTQSYMSTMQLGKGGNASRNTANVLVVEDRLSLDPNSKLGTRDRIPMINNGNATLSNQLFQPIDWGENNNLAIFDVFINGQHFPFTTTAFKEYTFNQNPATSPNWDPDCYTIPGTPPITGGCARVYKVVGNYEASANWCDDQCTVNLPANERFDLDVFNKKNTATAFSNGYGASDVPAGIRPNFSWQWFLVPAIAKGGIALDNISLKDNWGQGANILNGLGAFKDGDVYDVDGDGKEEIVHDFNCGGVKKGGVIPGTGVVTCVRVADSQEGDVDFTINDRDKANGKLSPGLQDDVQMFSFTKGLTGGPVGNEGGTYLRVEEGKLFDISTGRFVRSTNRQNHVDIIQRIFRISNNTGRFCNGNTPTATVSGLPNPVEACNNCFSQVAGMNNVTKTCIDTVQKLIFIRSRIEDLRGRRWVTKVLE